MISCVWACDSTLNAQGAICGGPVGWQCRKPRETGALQERICWTLQNYRCCVPGLIGMSLRQLGTMVPVMLPPRLRAGPTKRSLDGLPQTTTALLLDESD